MGGMLVAILLSLLPGSSTCDSAWRSFQAVWAEVIETSAGEPTGLARLQVELDRLRQRASRRSARCETVRDAAAALTKEYACLESRPGSCDRIELDSLVAEVVRRGDVDLLRAERPISANMVPRIDSLVLAKARRSEDLRQTLRRSALDYGVRPYLLDACTWPSFAADPGTWEHCANYVFEFRGLQGWRKYRGAIRDAAGDDPVGQGIDRIEPLGKAWLRESIHGGVSFLGSRQGP